MRKIIILTALLIGAKLNAFAQTTEITDSNTIFSLVEKMPSYIGGDNKLSEFLSSSIDFSQIGKLEKCIYMLAIGKAGQVMDVNKERGDMINIEQLKTTLMKTSGQWEPGSQNGHKCNVYQAVVIDILKDKIKAQVLSPTSSKR